MVELFKSKYSTRIKLTPNRSLTWFQAKLIMIIMIFIVMVIALAWSFVGAWLVLPFAGIEVGLFVFLLYKVTKWTYLQQIITFTEDEIIVETGINKRLSLETIDKEGLEILFTESELNWHIPRVDLRNKQLSIQIGEFLNAEDSQILKNSFEQLGYPVCKNRWWQH